MPSLASRTGELPALLLSGIARHRTRVLWGLGVAAVLLRVALAFYCPTPFGYVYDYYYEAIELFWKTGRLPLASDCWQCYHPPMFYLLGLPFYAAGRWLTASLESSPEWGLRFLSLMPLAAGAITAIYSARLVDRLVADRGLSTVAVGLVLAFPCLFISSYAPEGDIVVSAFMTMFLFYLTEWLASAGARLKPGTTVTPRDHAGWRRPAAVGVLAGLAAATKYSGLIALATAGAVLGIRLLTGPARLRVVRDGLVVLAAALAIGGWKYVDNSRRYGTPLFANGSAGDAFSSTREYYWDRYDFVSFSPRAIVEVAQPDSQKGELTSLDVYRSVWTTLYGMAWTDMSFFTVPGRISDPAAPYPWKHMPRSVSRAVVYLALVPTALAVLGGVLLLGRREYLPLHVMLALTLASYVAWVVAQDDWALKTKYILFLLPIYIIYAMKGAEWILAPRATVPGSVTAGVMGIGVVVALIALVAAAHVYDLAFALGHL